PSQEERAGLAHDWLARNARGGVARGPEEGHADPLVGDERAPARLHVRQRVTRPTVCLVQPAPPGAHEELHSRGRCSRSFSTVPAPTATRRGLLLEDLPTTEGQPSVANPGHLCRDSQRQALGLPPAGP